MLRYTLLLTSILSLFFGTPMGANKNFFVNLHTAITAQATQLEHPPNIFLSLETENGGITEEIRPDGSYTWEVIEPDGFRSSIIACGIHVMAYGSYPEILLPEQKNTATLSFVTPPDTINIQRWPAADWGAYESYGFGETVDINSKNEFSIDLTAGGSIYEITVNYPQGRVSYAIYFGSQPLEETSNLLNKGD